MASTKPQQLRELLEDHMIALLSKPVLEDTDFVRLQAFCRTHEVLAVATGPYSLAYGSIPAVLANGGLAKVQAASSA